MAQIDIMRKQQRSLKLYAEEHLQCIWDNMIVGLREIFENWHFQIIAEENVHDLERNNCQLEKDIKFQIEQKAELEAKLAKTENVLKLTQQSLKNRDLENYVMNLQDSIS